MEKQAMRFLIDAGAIIDGAILFVERQAGDGKSKKYLEDTLHDLKAALADAKEICSAKIAELRLSAYGLSE